VEFKWGTQPLSDTAHPILQKLQVLKPTDASTYIALPLGQQGNLHMVHGLTNCLRPSTTYVTYVCRLGY
jgi:hypothetical protein